MWRRRIAPEIEALKVKALKAALEAAALKQAELKAALKATALDLPPRFATPSSATGTTRPLTVVVATALSCCTGTRSRFMRYGEPCVCVYASLLVSTPVTPRQRQKETVAALVISIIAVSVS